MKFFGTPMHVHLIVVNMSLACFILLAGVAIISLRHPQLCTVNRDKTRTKIQNLFTSLCPCYVLADTEIYMSGVSNNCENKYLFYCVMLSRTSSL